ncbi:DOCK family protein [Pelomyxa schiedti]|nr:DOCK family protein [Pelomyxa schiedti]
MLPDIVMTQVIWMLPLVGVVALGGTCSALRKLTLDETFWERAVKNNTNAKTSSAASRLITLKQLTWRQLYFQHRLFNGSCLKDAEVVESLILPTPEYEHDKAAYLLQLAEYYKYSGKIQQYKEKLDSLHKMYVSLKAHIEAGLCALEKSKLYSWEDKVINETAGVSEFHLKEQAIKSAMMHFGEGKYWEWALEYMEILRAQISKSLAAVRPTGGGSGDKTSHLMSSKSSGAPVKTGVPFLQPAASGVALKLEAKLAGFQPLKEMYTKCLQTHDRLFEQYFLVEFTGKCDAFGKNVENKKFIMRGDEGERILPFVKKLQARFSKAKIIYTNTSEREGECIYVHSCDPVILTPHVATMLNLPYNPPKIPEDAPPKSRAFYNQLDLRVFVYTKPFMKDVPPGTSLSEEEKFSKLWISQTYLVTGHSFPYLLRRAEIVKEKEILKCPIENACDSLKAKTRDIRLKAEATNAKPTPQSINSLSMAISGVVDAAVSGGVKHYMGAFLTREFIENNQTQQRLVKKLIKRLHAQRHALFDAIQIHRNVTPTEMNSLHDKLEGCFEQWKKTLEEKCDYADSIIYTSRSSSSVSSLSRSTPPFSASTPDLLSEITGSLFSSRDRESPVELQERTERRRRNLSLSYGSPFSRKLMLEQKTHHNSEINVPGSESSQDSLASSSASVHSCGSAEREKQRERVMLLQPTREHSEDPKRESSSLMHLDATQSQSSQAGSSFRHARRNANTKMVPVVSPVHPATTKVGPPLPTPQTPSQLSGYAPIKELESVQSELEDWKSKCTVFMEQAELNTTKLLSCQELVEQLRRENKSLTEEINHLKTNKEETDKTLLQAQEDLEECKGLLVEEQKKSAKFKTSLKQTRKQNKETASLLETAMAKEKSVAQELKKFNFPETSHFPPVDI